jgi:hypothetical protein
MVTCGSTSPAQVKRQNHRSRTVPALSNQAGEGNSERSCDAPQSFEGRVLANTALDLREIWLGKPISFSQHALTNVSSFTKSLHRFPKTRSPRRVSYVSSHYAEGLGRRIATGESNRTPSARLAERTTCGVSEVCSPPWGTPRLRRGNGSWARGHRCPRRGTHSKVSSLTNTNTIRIGRPVRSAPRGPESRMGIRGRASDGRTPQAMDPSGAARGG